MRHDAEWLHHNGDKLCEALDRYIERMESNAEAMRLHKQDSGLLTIKAARETAIQFDAQAENAKRLLSELSDILHGKGI